LLSLILDGLYNPLAIDLPFFLFLEGLTCLIEFFVMYILNAELNHRLTLGEMVKFTLLMNVASAFFALPIWLNRGGF